MAVVNNFWLRDNKQRLGGAVIYQSNGQTLMRQLAPTVSNPRTDAQMETRVKLANLVAFYRASAGWMRGAFETKPANQSDYNAFVSANAANNNVWLTKSQVDAGNAIVAPYIVSRGSLGEITQVATDGLIASNLYTGNLILTGDTTIAQLTSALLSNNNGLLEGDQLSVIQYIQNTSTDGNYTITCRPYELILNLSNGAPVNNFIPTDNLVATGGDNSALAYDTEGFTGGVAFVLSRTVGGRILVSSSSVSLTFGNDIYTLMTRQQQKSEALRSYGSNTIVFLDSNMADQANAGVETQPRILALSIGGQQYAPGANIPRSYTDEQIISVILSAPVSVGEFGYIQINSIGGNVSIEGNITPAGAITGNSLNYSITAPGTLPESTTVNVEIELSDDSVISATYYTADDGLE